MITPAELISISGSASRQEKTQALKEIEKLKKVINELNDYEKEILSPLIVRGRVLKNKTSKSHQFENN